MTASGITVRISRFGRLFVPVTRHWSGLLLSLLMLVGAPLCFYGGLARGEITANNSNSNNEEHEERPSEEAGIVQRIARPPTAQQVSIDRSQMIRAHRVVELEPEPVFSRPSRFERRLI